MTAEIRSLSDFENFPGELTNNDCIYAFPLINMKDSKGKNKTWQIMIGIKKNSKSIIKKVNWEVKLDEFAKIDDTYFTNSDPIPSKYVVQSWTDSGSTKGKITRSAPTLYKKVMNEGKANQRNQFQTAMISCRDKYLKKKAKTEEGSDQNLFYPMLAEKFDKGKKHLVFPLYVQPKLDGNRCICFFDGKQVIFYSRNKKIFNGLDYLAEDVINGLKYMNSVHGDYCKKDKDESDSDGNEEDSDNDGNDEKTKTNTNKAFYIDGELYKHGVSLQKISSASKDPKNNEKIEYHIYDCFYADCLDMPYNERMKLIDVFFSKVSKDSNLRQVETKTAANEKQMEEIYKNYLDQGYEGVILRNKKLKYQGNIVSPFSTRSKELVKMKPKETEEFKVVDYTDGKNGKEKGAVIWIAETKDGKKFNVTPKNMNYEERYEVYKECEHDFDKKYKNKMLTIEYEDLSDEGIPLRAKALVFRDYE